MSSEYATEQVPLAENQEGDTIQDPESGQWFTVTRTADGKTSVTHKHSDGDRTVIEGYRVYYGDERQGEHVDSRCIIDSRFTKGLVTRQVRESVRLRREASRWDSGYPADGVDHTLSTLIFNRVLNAARYSSPIPMLRA